MSEEKKTKEAIPASEETKETTAPVVKGKRSRAKNQEKPVSKKKDRVKVMLDLVDEERLYEMMMIVDADLTEKKRAARIEEVKKVLTAEGAEITFDDQTWGVRELCYRIKKKWHGYYFVLNFKMKASKIAEVKNTFDLDQEVLRYLIIKLPEDHEAQTYEELKDKYDVITFEEKQERIKQARKQVKKKEIRTVELKSEEKVEAPKAEEKKEEVASRDLPVQKEEAKKEEKTEAKESKKEEKKSDDHLKELNDKLDKLLLSDDL
jgi:small subunit ribosomal protein S6